MIDVGIEVNKDVENQSFWEHLFIWTETDTETKINSKPPEGIPDRRLENFGPIDKYKKKINVSATVFLTTTNELMVSG